MLRFRRSGKQDKLNSACNKDYKLSSRMLENDIMLIRLPRPAQLNGGVQLACLPLPGRAGVAGLQDWSAVGSRATVVGWGFSCYVEDNGKEFCTHSGSELNSTVGSSIQQYVEVGNSLCAIFAIFTCFDLLIYRKMLWGWEQYFRTAPPLNCTGVVPDSPK